MITPFFLCYTQIPALKKISTKLLLTHWTRESQEVISKGLHLDLKKACKNDRKHKEILQLMKSLCKDKDFLNQCQIPALDEILKICPGGEDCLYRNCVKSDKVAKIVEEHSKLVSLATLIQQQGWEADGRSAGPTQQDMIPRHLAYMHTALRKAVKEKILPEKNSEKEPWAWCEGSKHLENARNIVSKYIADTETKAASSSSAEPIQEILFVSPKSDLVSDVVTEYQQMDPETTEDTS